MNDLRPDRKLLNHQFNGYKLASTPLHSLALSLPASVDQSSQNANQYSYLSTRIRQMHNHIYLDEWNSITYFVDAECRISTFTCKDDGTPSELYHVSAIPQRDREFSRLSCSLLFPCETLALVCDGGGSVFIVHTGHRKKGERQEWGADKDRVVIDLDRPTELIQANIEKDILHLICLTLEEGKEGGNACVFHWLQIKLNFDVAGDSAVKGLKRFMCKDFPKAVWLSEDYSHLLVAASKTPHLVNENLDRVEPPPSTGSGDSSLEKIYEWTQSRELLTISFNLCLTENELDCEIKHNHLSVKLKNGRNLLEGNVEKDIIRDASRWYVDNNRLEVVLVKKDVGQFWNALVPEDSFGTHLIEGEEAARIEEIGDSLSHLTSDNPNAATPAEQRSSFNMAQLEDCDDYGEEDIKLYSIDVFTGEVVTLKNMCGHQWLFTKVTKDNKAPYMCVRHDVDGIVWQVSDLTSWHHRYTFDAFGFVHASKKDCKFTSCTPDFSYVFVTDCTSHLYTYESGGTDPCQHSQFVTRFFDTNKILGCKATNSHLYVLTDKHLNVISLP